MIWLMAAIMMGSGARIRLMEEGYFIIKMGNLNMMVNGEMISLMVGELYILRLELGRNMKESSKMESRKEEEECILPMVLYMMASSEVIRSQEEVEK